MWPAAYGQEHSRNNGGSGRMRGKKREGGSYTGEGALEEEKVVAVVHREGVYEAATTMPPRIELVPQWDIAANNTRTLIRDNIS
jgi:hypothetical protein